MMLGLLPSTVFADGTYTFKALTQSGNNYSTLRYYITDENAGVITVAKLIYRDGVSVSLVWNEGWYFEKWETYFNGYEDIPIFPDKQIQGSNPVNDDGVYTFYNKDDNTKPLVNTLSYFNIETETGYYGDHSATAVLKPIVTVNAGDGVTYVLKTNNPTTISENQTAVKYKEDVTITYQIDEKYTFISADATGTKNTDASTFGTVKLFATEKPTAVAIYTRLKQQTVRFDANGGSGTMAPQTFEHSVAQTLTANSFTRTGYRFDGWNTSANGSGTAYEDKVSTTFAPVNDGDSITLYAQWTACTNHSWVNGICEFCGASCSAHSYVYSSDGNTITEACANGCTHNETATITKPDTLVYDGAAKEATVTYSDNWKGGELTITYSANGNIKAGDVTASIEKGGAKATVDFAIEKAVITVTADAKTITYGEAEPALTYTASGLVSGESLNGTLTREAGTDVGTYAIKQGTLTTENNPNYDITFVGSTFTINKANPTYTAPVGLNATYGQTLADVTLPEGFTWQDADTTSVGNIGNNTFKAIYTPSDTDNYNIVKDIEVTVTVGKKPVTVILENDYTGCTVEGAGNYADGDSVTVKATATEGTQFAYWLDASVTFDDTPTAEELKAAIVSYDATYTFTATKDVTLKAVFAAPVEVPITPLLIKGKEKADLENAEWMDVEYDFGVIKPDENPIELPGEIVKDIITIENKQYKFAGFIVYGYDEATVTDTIELLNALTIGKIPLYDSAEYWDWYAPISDGVYVAYMEYTPEDDSGQQPENPDTPDNPDDKDDPDDKPQTPSNPQTPDGSEEPEDTQTPTSPQTGDNSNLALWIALLFISGGAVITLTVVDRKRRSVNH